MPDLVCFTLPYRAVEFERSLQGIKGTGYESVGFGLAHADGGYPTKPGVEEATRIGKILERYALRPRVLYGARTQGGDVDELKAWIDFAHALDDQAILVWVGVGGYRRFPNEPLTPEEMEERHRPFVETMKQVAAHAEKKGITVTLKPHTGNTATGPVLAKTLEDIGSPAFKACLDPGNVSYYEGVDPVADVEPVLTQTAALTMKDHRGARANADFPIPGEGDVDFVQILKRLRAHNFDGPLMVERVDGADGANISVEEIDRRIAKARENTVAMAKEAGYDL